MAELTAVAVAPDGRLAMADAKSVQVMVYREDGSFLATVGARGDGPGEFRHPLAVTFGDEGELYVVDGSPPSLVLFTPDLMYDTTFEVREALVALEVEVIGTDVSVLTYRDKVGDRLLRRYQRDGELLDGLHELDRAIVTQPDARDVAADIRYDPGDCRLQRCLATGKPREAGPGASGVPGGSLHVGRS